MNQTARKTQPWKRAAIVAFQAVLALAVLTFIFANRERRAEMEQALRHANVAWVIAGILCYGVVELLGGLRWYLLLRVQGFRLSWRRATSIFIIGLFFLTFTPGLIGGDAARVLYVIRETPERKAEAVLVVAMDRLMGLVSLILLAALALLLRYDWFATTPATSWLEYVTLLILAASGAMVLASVLAARIPWLSILHKNSVVSEKAREIGDAFHAYRRHWPRIIQALANTIAAHLLYYLTFYCAARALGAFGGPNGHTAHPWRGALDIFSVMPIINTLTGLPISFAGIGIRESLFQVLLNDLCHIPPGVAAAIGSLGFAMRAVWGLPGGLLLLRYKASSSKTRSAG